jgi:hypothetical protein
MDNEFAQSYYVVQGYIDAKDDRGRITDGTFISLVTRRDVKYTSVAFGMLEMNKSMSWRDLLPLHEEVLKKENRDPLLLHHEERLNKFFETSLVLTHVAKNLNAKPAEQAISRFCLDELKLKAVCFVSFSTASEDDLATFRAAFHKGAPPAAKPPASPPPAQMPEIKTPTPDAPRLEQTKEGKELFVRCDPILDPVRGVAMNDLSVGNDIYGRLAPDSIIYKLLAKNNPRFNGVITAKVSGILTNELGTATVSLMLSDGVAGVMKLSGKVRVKVAKETEGEASGLRKRSVFLSGLSPLTVPPEIIFAAAGIVVIIAALLVMYYIFP